jgi:hypothetical protein
LKIGIEVDLPGEHLGQPNRQLRAFARRVDRLKQRRCGLSNLSRRRRLLECLRNWQHLGTQSIVGVR